MKYRPIPRELSQPTPEARERGVGHWETVRPEMQPAAKAKPPGRSLEEMRADPLPHLSEYALMTKAERAAKILEGRQ